MRAEPVTNVSGLRDWSLRPDERHTARKWALLLFIFLLGFLCGAASASAAELPCVQIRVRPRVMMARGDIDVQTRVCRRANHRHLRIAWTSDTGWAGSSERELAGAAAPVLYQFWLVDVPAANYDFLASVRNSDGRIAGRDRAQIYTPLTDDGR